MKELVIALFLGTISSVQLRNYQPFGAFEKERDGEAAYPAKWVPEQWPGQDHKDVKDFIEYHVDSKTGRFKTEWEVSEEKAAEAQKDLEETWAKPYYRFPVPTILEDWTGDKYVTSHRCYGHPCKSDVKKDPSLDINNKYMRNSFDPTDVQNLVQTEQSPIRFSQQPYEDAQKERDAAAGYGTLPPSLDKDTHEAISRHVDLSTGRYKTPFEVANEIDAEQEQKLQETYSKPAFVVQDWMLDDWTGHKYVTSHRCYGSECKSDLKKAGMLLQTGDDERVEDVDGVKFDVGTYNIGDLQAHKYTNLKAWEKDMLPHKDTVDKEEIHKFIYDRYDMGASKLRTPQDIEAIKENAKIDAEKEAAKNFKAYVVPDSVVDDWTGHKFTNDVLCYGKSPCTKVELAKEK